MRHVLLPLSLVLLAGAIALRATPPARAQAPSPQPVCNKFSILVGFNEQKVAEWIAEQKSAGRSQIVAAGTANNLLFVCAH